MPCRGGYGAPYWPRIALTSDSAPGTVLIRVTPLILAVALFMEHIDSTVIATSLPAIAADIGTEPTSLKLALTAYFVALAIFIPISGWMADRFGAKNIFRVAIFIFMLGSLACAFSFSLETFVLSRFLQGMGASMMTPVARLLLVRSTPRTQLVSAMAWLTMPALIGPVVGPLLGGFLTTYMSWHWIFWINIPIGAAGIVLSGLYLTVPDERHPRPIDVLGFFLAGIAFAGGVFGLSVVSLPALPMWYGYATLGIGILAWLLYLLHARRTEHPLLDLRLLRHRYFRSTIIAGSLFRVGVGATPFLLPLMLQVSFGLSPLESGAITFVSAIGAMGSKSIAERVYARFGLPRSLGVASLLGGMTVAAFGLFNAQTSYAVMVSVILLSGALRSMMFTGANAFGYADVSDAEASQATAIVAVSQQLSIALGVAVGAGVLEVSTRLHGGEMALGDFQLAFLVVGGLSMLASIVYLRLPRDAGHELARRRAPKPLEVSDG